MSTEERLQLKEETREMFLHGYNGYMKDAFPGGELLPLSCQSGELHLVKVTPTAVRVRDVCYKLEITAIPVL